MPPASSFERARKSAFLVRPTVPFAPTQHEVVACWEEGLQVVFYESRCGSQVVRHRFAKPTYVGSNPIRTSGRLKTRRFTRRAHRFSQSMNDATARHQPRGA